ncbi:MAG: agmatine deiminase family protein [Alphaproteobacteria bacterium]|nr:agmatine deiminase family protein [Alphaproteobacteria bacterium]
MTTLKMILGLLIVFSSSCTLSYAHVDSGKNPSELGFIVPAEFSEQESVWLAWPQYEPMAGKSNIPQIIEIISAIIPHQYIDLVVNDKKEEELARNWLANAGVPLNQVRFHHLPHTDFWMRDIGAIFIRDKNGQLAAIDLKFNGWGMGSVSPSFKDSAQIDNGIAVAMADRVGVPVYKSDLIAEGGGLEFNGNGTLITTESVILQPQRNPGITKPEAEKELKRLFGIKKIIWLKQGITADDSVFYGPLKSPVGPVLTALATNGHTDEFVRWINDDTILLAEVTKEESDAAGEDSFVAETRRRLERNYETLAKSTNQDGKPLKIIRIPVAEEIYKTLQPGDSTYEAVNDMCRADDAHDGEPILSTQNQPATFVAATSYLNYLVTNKVVLIAQYWKPGRPDIMRVKDLKAREIIQSAFPDRRVIAINHMEDINIGGGGIHCISQQMPAQRFVER